MKDYKFYLNNHNAYCVTPVSDRIVRIRYNSSGVYKQTLMERYDIITYDFPEIESSITEKDGKVIINAGQLCVKVNEDSSFSFCLGEKTLIENLMPFQPQEDVGVGGKIKIGDNDRFYGGGYRPNNDIELRNQIIRNWCSPVINNGPSPIFHCSNGWGLFWNNTCKTFFDFGNKKRDELVFWCEDGDFDIFLFAGDYKQIIKDYTSLTGKPSIMPMFGYGITTVNGEAETEISLLDKAERMRREGIPGDTFSISCEWMEKYYDKSVNQAFDVSRYFVKNWMHEENTFIHTLKHFGIKATLWTPCGYDLTYEQERRYHRLHPGAEEKPMYDRQVRKNDNSSMSIDANSRLFRDDNLIRVEYHDPYTIRDEAWVEHFKKFFDLGIDGIAEDACAVTITKADHFYGNGYSYKYMHNLNQTLNSMQYFEGFKEHTGKRIFVRTPSTFVGHQKYCGTWCGDTTSDTSLVGLVQYSFQGQSNVTADLISNNKEQIHSGMLMPWVLNFCWGHQVWLWMLPENLQKTYMAYAKLRYALMPYIYTAAYNAHKSGISMCTAMIINYPDDERFYNNSSQYMFGDDILVGCDASGIDLPEGKWIDFWTGKEYDGMQRVTDGYPEPWGGYLFVKKGSILPMWENIDYVGQRPIDSMTVKIYPCETGGEYALYEDDGITFDYEKGKFAVTNISYKVIDGHIEVLVAKPEGEYEGKPEHREYHIELVMENPDNLPDGAIYDDEKGTVCFTISDNGKFCI